MKKIILLFIALIFGSCILAGCNKSKLYITGDEEAIGAKVIIHGKEVGIMGKGPKSGALLTLSIPAGEYDIIVISKNGERLTTRFLIKGENYLGVDFARMTIRN